MTRTQRRRAYIYLTREQEGQLEVAVFRHPDETITLQVPGGTTEPHETPEAGALREAFEESGLIQHGSPFSCRPLEFPEWRR